MAGAFGKIHRDAKAKHDFMKQTGYPNDRPGYIVDHIVPLKKGGCDCPADMQWQTKAEPLLTHHNPRRHQ